MAIETKIFEYISIFISLFGEITPADGYTLKIRYRNLASFSSFFFSLVAIETKFCRILYILYFSFWRNYSSWWVYTLKTQYRNLASFSFFSLTCGDWNQLLSNIFIFLYFSFWRAFARKRTAPSPTHIRTYLSSLVSRLVRVGKGQGASAFARERERANFVFVSVRARVLVLRCLNRWAYLSPWVLTRSRLRTSSCGARRSCNQANQEEEEEEEQQRSRNRSSSSSSNWKRTESSKTGDKRCRKTLKKHQQQ